MITQLFKIGLIVTLIFRFRPFTIFFLRRFLSVHGNLNCSHPYGSSYLFTIDWKYFEIGIGVYDVSIFLNPEFSVNSLCACQFFHFMFLKESYIPVLKYLHILWYKMYGLKDNFLVQTYGEGEKRGILI